MRNNSNKIYLNQLVEAVHVLNVFNRRQLVINICGIDVDNLLLWFVGYAASHLNKSEQENQD